MKIAVLAVIALGTFVLGAHAQNYRFYDNNGFQHGRADWNGNGWNYYDNNGFQQGHSQWNGNGYNFYDNNGFQHGHIEGPQ